MFEGALKMKKLSLLTVIILSTLVSLNAHAQYRDKKINTRKLVDDYWTPSEKKYSLIQQRYFVKTNRVFVSASAGVHINNPEHEGYLSQFSGGYFLSEKWGFEVQYTGSSLSGNSVIERLDSLSGGSSTLDRTKTLSYIGGAINYSPIYAKMSFLGYKILYYDLILSGQLGQTSYEQTVGSSVGSSPKESAITFGLGITQMFYLNKHFSIKLDFSNRWYNADVLKYTTGNELKSRLIQDTQMSLGVTFML